MFHFPLTSVWINQTLFAAAAAAVAVAASTDDIPLAAIWLLRAAAIAEGDYSHWIDSVRFVDDYFAANGQ